MERLVGRVAVVTGAASGIGAVTSKLLAKNGVQVIGSDINVERLGNLQKDIADNPDVTSKGGLFYPIKCDLTKEEEILSMFKVIEEHFKGVDICLNVAGVGHNASIMEGETWQWKHMMDVNVMSYAICCREAVKQMQVRQVSGHIINVCSMAGREIRPAKPDFSFYNMTKYAVTALTKSLRQEMLYKNMKIRVGQVCPGIVETEFTHKMYEGDPVKIKATEEIYKQCKVLQAEDVAEAIVFMLSRPDHVQIHDMWMTHP